ncbi:MAG: lasso peptide biosynthesis B2 protein [Candidatus Competibacteraceae bacterium]
MKALRKLLDLPGVDIGLLLEAALMLGVARLAIALIPFRHLAPCLGVRQSSTPAAPLSEEHARLVKRIGWAIRVAAGHLPWKAVCLPQAMAAKLMLRRRGFASTLYLGVSQQGAEFKAHAWIRTGDVIVTGYQDIQRYTVVSSFA